MKEHDHEPKINKDGSINCKICNDVLRNPSNLN